MYLPEGIIPPVPTFVTEDFKLDTESMKTAIDHLIGEGVNGLFFLGTGGEFTHMSKKERKEVGEFAVQYVNGRVPVLIGTGTPDTRQTMELNEHAYKTGADGVVVINPYYFSFSEEHLLNHYNTVLDHTELPVLLYNFPGLTGQEIPAGLVKELVGKHENLVGIKNTVDSLSNTKELLYATEEFIHRFSVLAGFDDYILAGLHIGCRGAITGTANIAPALSVLLYEAYISKNYEKAIKNQQKISKLCRLYALDTPFVGIIKEAMKQTGMAVSSQTLPPLIKADEKQIERIKIILQECEL
ncbi:dihydrodipicolinate synthase family protein [Salipaludibacillus aurantiacus]|uniref:4-hydroxy-tetrahydrodipicolinate synthase n=1 Tax=Salipaludibacillus aurantiacus TaxID=1601833 RepID=A0A1H9UBB2_9BACI|nr:dihydrodipicolinate synthase family protein [Salipaludibacillus aurantiacus]SES06551.1 4-hydroxy-tetrahydrodipicolinate synthase [Salipaludibacillus aurantiacus]